VYGGAVERLPSQNEPPTYKSDPSTNIVQIGLEEIEGPSISYRPSSGEIVAPSYDTSLVFAKPPIDVNVPPRISLPLYTAAAYITCD
jgi:hypothetical protein